MHIRTADSFDKTMRVGAAALTLLYWGVGASVVRAETPVVGITGPSVPAEFVKALRLPGEGDQILRPSAIFTDMQYGETYVADTGHNRLVVFDRDGVYRFDFDCMDHVGTPLDVAVDSRGMVHVLGTSREGWRIVRFDFDGLYLQSIALEAGKTYQSLSIDELDQLYLVEPGDHEISVRSTDGAVLRTIPLTTMFEDVAATELIYGKPFVADGKILLPVSSLGTVAVLDSESGQRTATIGYQGNTAGELNFPVAVTLLPGDMVAILDKMRFTVLCFSFEGRFLGEFGGKGYRDGWFYHPSLLSVDGAGRVIVGQIFDSRIQVCTIPQFIHDKHSQSRPAARRGDGGEVGVRTNGAAATTLRES